MVDNVQMNLSMKVCVSFADLVDPGVSADLRDRGTLFGADSQHSPDERRGGWNFVGYQNMSSGFCGISILSHGKGAWVRSSLRW